MDGNGRQQEQHQDAHMQQQKQQQQPSDAWYGGGHGYQQPQTYKWAGHDSPMHYSQPPAQPYGQHEYYYIQQQQLYGPPMPEAQHEHGHMYNQRHQICAANTGWNQPQWSYQDTNTTTTIGVEEKDWAAKARAWAAAKTAQDTVLQAQQARPQPEQAQQIQLAQLAQPIAQVQGYKEYRQVASLAVKLPQYPTSPLSLQPPGREGLQGKTHEPTPSHGQDIPSYVPETTSIVPDDATQKAHQDRASPPYAQVGHLQDESSSHSQDATSAGKEQQEQVQQQSPCNFPPSPSRLTHQESLIQSPLQLHAQLQAFPYTEQPIASFDFHQHQQFEFPPRLQPPSQFLPPGPTMGLEGAEMSFGGAQVWSATGTPGMGFPPGVGPGLSGSISGPQFEHAHHTQHPHPAHRIHGHPLPRFFSRAHGPGFHPGPHLGGPFGFGGNPPLGQGLGPGVGPVFSPDTNGTLGGPDRPKKAPVPSWLREELMKKKSEVVARNSLSMAVTGDFIRANGNDSFTVQGHKMGPVESTRSEVSGMSDYIDEDDVNDIEETKLATINQEIKRVLTEVLLKVTDELFDEIAQEVIDEDEHLLAGGQQAPRTFESTDGQILRSASSPSAPAALGLSAPSRVVVASIKGNRHESIEDFCENLSSEGPVGNVLGLANYASDDEDGERSCRQVSAVVVLEMHAKRQRQKEDSAEAHESGQRADVLLGEEKYEGKSLQLEELNPVMEKEKVTRMSKENEGMEEERRELEGLAEQEVKVHKDKKREVRAQDKGVENDGKKREHLEFKGKKRLNDNTASRDQDIRSPRWACPEAESAVSMIDDVWKDQVGTENPQEVFFLLNKNHPREERYSATSGRSSQSRVLDDQVELSDPAEKGYISMNPHPKGLGNSESKHDRQIKQDQVKHHEGSKVLGISKKSQTASAYRSSKKSRDKYLSKDHDGNKHRSQVGVEVLEKMGRSREKEKIDNKLGGRGVRKYHENVKLKDFDSGDGDKLRERDKTKDQARGHDRDGRKVDERYKRGRDRGREPTDTKKSQRHSSRHSSSTNSRGRSCSRSPWSGSQRSSSGGRSKSPKIRHSSEKRGRQLSTSHSPVRSRRRSSRLRSRSPPSKYAHRRHSRSRSHDIDR